MRTTVEERSPDKLALNGHHTPNRLLAKRLRPRMAVEEMFARAGGKVKTKSFFRRYESRFFAPVVKAGLHALGLYSRGEREALSPVVTELDVCSPTLPKAFHGFRLLQLSDLHIDGVDGLTEKLVPVLNRIEADLCVLTGDYRFEDEGPCDEVYRRMRKLIAAMSSRHGIYGILGNHDESGIALELQRLGVHMLINEAVEIRGGQESIWLAGVDDPFDYECDDLPATMANVPLSAFKILLAHTPELYKEASERGIDLYLCGHTHGGQVRFPGIGALRSNANCPRSYTYRSWSYRAMQGYTSGGIGCSSLPVRLNCPPEIVLLTLKHESL
jgi:predicted MPP superfamily phosphohydrolase